MRMPTVEHAKADIALMRRALELAQSAERHGDVPVGAVVAFGDEIAAVGFNQKEANHDPTAHAEMVALRQASARKGGWRLSGATLYVTKEPCIMCAAACVAARIDRLVYGCPDPKGGGAGSVYDVVQDARLNHRLHVTAGVLGDEAAEMLRVFFRARRAQDEL